MELTNELMNWIGVGLMALTVILYIVILWHQYGFMKKNTLTYRLVILNVRTAIIIPGFSICYFFSLFFPHWYLLIQIPEAFIQAYAVFCFFALFVTYVGSPSRCVQIFRTTTHTFPACIFGGCLHNNPRSFYGYSHWAQLQFMFLRPVIVVLMVIAGYLNYTKLTLLLSFITTVMVAWAICWLVKFYHVLFDYCKGLNATTKVMIIKGTIGLVLGEGFLEDILFEAGFINESNFNKYTKYYCFVVLIELLLISVWLERVFANEIKVGKADNQAFSPRISEAKEDCCITFSSFLVAVFSFHDVFGPVCLDPVDTTTRTDGNGDVVLSETFRPPSLADSRFRTAGEIL